MPWFAATAAKEAARLNARGGRYPAGMLMQPTLGQHPLAPLLSADPLGPFGPSDPVAPVLSADPLGPFGITPCAPLLSAVPCGPLGMFTSAPPFGLASTLPMLAHGVPSGLVQGGGAGAADASGATAIAAAAAPAKNIGARLVSFAIMSDGLPRRPYSKTARRC